MRSIVVKTGGTEEDIRSRTFAILKPIGKSNVLSEYTKFGRFNTNEIYLLLYRYVGNQETFQRTPTQNPGVN